MRREGTTCTRDVGPSYPLGKIAARATDEHRS